MSCAVHTHGFHDVLRAFMRPGIGIEIVLKRHAYQIANGVLQLFG